MESGEGQESEPSDTENEDMYNRFFGDNKTKRQHPGSIIAANDSLELNR